MATSPYTLIQGSCSLSPQLCRLVLWIRVLEPLLWFASFILAIIRMCVYPFLLVFFDSLVGKAFLAMSIKLCLVDNQRSSGVAVAGFESRWFEAGSSTSRSPPIECTFTSRKVGPGRHQCMHYQEHIDLFWMAPPMLVTTCQILNFLFLLAKSASKPTLLAQRFWLLLFYHTIG